ncbi:Serendipity locus protein beta [Frankliniella fusca]|uniref:Serendipity locus protein beta n=1 Tax=Frankliniella fusca TaxID=407009 RepID=A0AAE1HX56_9NEOP|nr:Serendipity locus protein beta [Frankliniella fusca]
MGVSLEVWRARIGSFNKAGATSSSLALLHRSLASTGGTCVLSLALIDVLLLIGCIEINPGPDQPYIATCSLCRTTFHSANTYADHQSLHLTNDKNFKFPCPFCEDHFFGSVSGFLNHHYRFHFKTSRLDSAPAAPAADLFSDVLLDPDYRCSTPTCQMKCRTLKELRKHTETHIKSGFVMNCPFRQACPNNVFSKVSTFRSHCSQYHKNVATHERDIITYQVNESGSVGFSDDVEDQVELSSDSGESDDECDDNNENFFDCQTHKTQSDKASHDDVYPENSVRHHVGKFYLWLEGVLLIPATKVQLISEEIAQLCEMSHHRIKVNLKEQLMKEGIQASRAENLIDTALKRDVIWATHHKGQDVVNMCTDHMRKQFYQQRCAYLESKEISLGCNDAGKKKFAHYIPVQNTLQKMFNDPSVQQQIDASFARVSTPGIYIDYTDGSPFKKHPVSGYMNTIQLTFFQDAFEFYPLSPTAGNYKCVGFYFVLGNFHPNVRSKVDAIQLALIVKENYLKFFGQENVMKVLINEMTHLSHNGIKYKGETLPVIFNNMCGDNLGQHFIGGYLESFRSEHFCRFCEVSKRMFEKNATSVMPFRTRDEYNKIVSELQAEDNVLYQKKGIKQASVLNKIPFYHVCNGQLPCASHDILEGFGKKDFALFLRCFIQVKQWVS